MSDLANFLRTEAKARKANDDGIWELLEEAADQIERLTRERDAAIAALKTIADHSSTESDFPHCVAGFQNYARRALEQTADK